MNAADLAWNEAGDQWVVSRRNPGARSKAGVPRVVIRPSDAIVMCRDIGDTLLAYGAGRSGSDPG